MTPLDPDRTLALTYVPAERRPAIGALWRLDAAMGAVLAGGREPLISQIKLAWWRDSLAKLDEAPAPGEPVLQDVAKHVLPRGIKGSQLARMEEGWSILLSTEPLTTTDLDNYSGGRGALLFRHSAQLLGIQMNARVKRAGEGWALADLARHSNAIDAAAALELARERLSDVGGQRWPASLRPLGMLAMLARRDAQRGLEQVEAQGAPARMLRMIGHRLTGR
nr:squalene/phytoene synthase family protein [uncultured Sphingosinicella sp.]